MIIPIIPRKLFQVNNNYTLTSFDNEILVIDNFYKNFDDIYNFLTHTGVPIFNDVGPTRESSNFQEYYQCRPNFFPGYKFTKHVTKIQNLIFEYFKCNHVPKLSAKTGAFEFNYFNALNSPANPQENTDFQAIPHRDYAFNAVIFMDKVGYSGTAIYDNLNEQQKSLIKQSFKNENKKAYIDVQKFHKYIVHSKPNRLVIFNGQRYHNGYIYDQSKFVDEWRIAQIMFFE